MTTRRFGRYNLPKWIVHEFQTFKHPIQYYYWIQQENTRSSGRSVLTCLVGPCFWFLFGESHFFKTKTPTRKGKAHIGAMAGKTGEQNQEGWQTRAWIAKLIFLGSVWHTWSQSRQWREKKNLVSLEKRGPVTSLITGGPSPCTEA